MSGAISISIEDEQQTVTRSMRKLILARDGCRLVALYTTYTRTINRNNNPTCEWNKTRVIAHAETDLSYEERMVLERKLIAVHEAFQSVFFQAEITEVPYPAHA